MNRDNIFLTETRREVLKGESDLSGGSLANEKSRIRTRARAAIDELKDVADSSEIDNRDVFDPENVGNLIYWIVNDPSHFDHQGGGLVAAPDDEIEDVDDSLIKRYDEELESYRRDIYAEVDFPLRSIFHHEKGRFPERRHHDG